MKYFFTHLPEIEKKIRRAGGALLLLDFDGTLAPLAPTPRRAALPAAARAELKKIAGLLPTAVISGRAVADIRRKVGLRGITYAGNHGLEWQNGGRRQFVATAGPAVRAAKKIFAGLARRYRGVLVEDKGLGLAVHYRRLARARASAFRREFFALAASVRSADGLRLSKGKMVWELSPDVNWDKGWLARLLWGRAQKKIHRRLLPIYAGDDRTDESAFWALRSGLTVKVGRGRSAAEYFIRGPRQAPRFLRTLSKFMSASS